MSGRGGVHRIHYPQATSGTLVSIANGATYGNSLAISRGASTFSMSMAASGNGNPVNVTTAANYPSSQWYHLAMTRDSTGTVWLFVNGSRAATGTYAGPGKTNDRILINGLYDNNGLGGSGSNACYDEIRFTAGVARYTSNFTVPTSAFPRR